MNVLTAIEPSLIVSRLFGLSTFDETLQTSSKTRRVSWSMFALRIFLQISDVSEVVGLKERKNSDYPLGSALIMFSCFVTTFRILSNDGVILYALQTLTEFNRNKFPIDRRRLLDMRDFCRNHSIANILFCIFFTGINVTWNYRRGNHGIWTYVTHCFGFFARFSTLSVLSNQILAYFSLMRLWYSFISDQLVAGTKQPKTIACKSLRKKIKLYIEADSIIKDFNENAVSIYSLYILLMCAVTLFECVYSTVYHVMNPQVRGVQLAFNFLLISFLFTQLCIFVDVAASTTKKTATIAHQIHDLLVITDDSQLYEQIEIFSFQLLHRNLEFSACGFFNLDLPLLYSMAGTITTYILILLQFETTPIAETYCQTRNCTNCK